MKTSPLALRILLAAVLATASAYLLSREPAFAQTLENDGVVGDMDRQSRNPHLTVSVNVGSESTSILADAFHPSDEFKKYPIQFEFFVNRNLFATQYRSVNLPGPVGVNVPTSVATVPFNYVVIAKVIHPNSIYTTVIEGAATADSTGNTPAGTLDCTLTLPATGEGEATIFTASNVNVFTVLGAGYTLSFESTDDDSDRTVTIGSTFRDAEGDNDATGTINVTEEGKDPQNLSGDALITTDSTGVSAVTISADDTVLSCLR